MVISKYPWPCKRSCHCQILQWRQQVLTSLSSLPLWRHSIAEEPLPATSQLVLSRFTRITFFIPLFSVAQPTAVLEPSEHALDPLAGLVAALWGRHCGRTCRSRTRQPRGGRRFKPCSPAARQSPGLLTNSSHNSVPQKSFCLARHTVVSAPHPIHLGEKNQVKSHSKVESFQSEVPEGRWVNIVDIA